MAWTESLEIQLAFLKWRKQESWNKPIRPSTHNSHAPTMCKSLDLQTSKIAACVEMKEPFIEPILSPLTLRAHTKQLCTDLWVKIQKQLHIDKWLLLSPLNSSPQLFLSFPQGVLQLLLILSVLHYGQRLIRLVKAHAHVSWRNLLQGGTSSIHTSQM